MLSVSVTHAAPLPPILRAIVSEYACNNLIFPFIRSILDFEGNLNNSLNRNYNTNYSY